MCSSRACECVCKCSFVNGSRAGPGEITNKFRWGATEVYFYVGRVLTSIYSNRTPKIHFRVDITTLNDDKINANGKKKIRGRRRKDG